MDIAVLEEQAQFSSLGRVSCWVESSHLLPHPPKLFLGCFSLLVKLMIFGLFNR
jgi:hypothetical protein